MQQLDDDSEIWKVPQEPPPEEPMRDVDEGGAQSPESPEKVMDGPARPLPEGRSGAKSSLESAPALPQRPLSAKVEESLLNGEVQDGYLLGSGCSPGEARGKGIPGPVDKRDPQPHQGGPEEAASAANPAGQSPDPGRAPAGRQRKLVMEEMVIRDHLGQEVGCMDAVGQSQDSLEKEAEELGHQPGPLDGVSDPNHTPGEGPLGHELGHRDGPEGASPPGQDPRGPSGALQDEDGSPRGQEGRPPEAGASPKEGADGRGLGQEAEPEESAPEEVAPAPSPGDAPPAEEPLELGLGSPMKTAEARPGSRLEPLTAPLPHQFPPGEDGKDPSSSRGETKIPFPDPVLPSSPTQVRVLPQDTVPSLPNTEESLLGRIPSQGHEGSLPGPEPSFVPSQKPLLPLDQDPSWPQSQGPLLLEQAPLAGQVSLSEDRPPSQPGPLPSSLGMKGEVAPLPDGKHSVVDQETSLPQGADGALLSGSQTLTGTQTASLPDPDGPISPPPEDEPLVLPHIPVSGHEVEKPTSQWGQECLGQGVEGSLPDTTQSLPDPLSSLPGAMVSLLETETSTLGGRQDPRPPPPEHPASPLPEADVCLPGQLAPSMGDPHESHIALLDQIPPVLQDTESTAVTGKTPASSPQEADGALPEEMQAALQGHASPHLPPKEEGASPDPAPPASGGPAATSPRGPAPTSAEAAESLPEGQNSSHPPPEERPPSAEQASPPGSAQNTPVCPSALPPPSQETLQPLLDQSRAVGGREEAEGRGCASMAAAGAGEAAEDQASLPAEEHPLLKGAKGPGDISAGGPLSKAGMAKPPEAASNHTPNNSSPRSSANTAHARQLQAAQGQGPEPEPEEEGGKRKSCQCCTIM